MTWLPTLGVSDAAPTAQVRPPVRREETGTSTFVKGVPSSTLVEKPPDIAAEPCGHLTDAVETAPGVGGTFVPARATSARFFFFVQTA